jgi:WD40 repeat protein
VVIYDGKDAKQIAVLTEHTGSVYALSWSPDGQQMLTSSADGTARIWDVNTQQVVTTFQFPTLPNAGHHQVGNIWQGKHLVSLSLNGDLNCLDPRAPEKPSRVLRGHQKAIVGLEVTKDKTMWSASYDGRICKWDEVGTEYVGNFNASVGLASTTSDQIYTADLDGQVYQMEGTNV